MKTRARIILLVALVTIVAYGAFRVASRGLVTPTEDAPELKSGPPGAPLPTLADAAQWVNGNRASADSLRGHPTVLALWSDTDPEAMHVLPILQSWHHAYARYGARIIGVHEPDFAFAADSTVPASLARRMRLTFPIALDPAYVIRQRFAGAMDGLRVVLVDPAGTMVAVEAGREGLARIEPLLRAELRSRHLELQFPADQAPTPAPETSTTAAPVDPPAARIVPLGSTRVSEGPLAGATMGRSAYFTAQFRYQVEGKAYVPYPVGLWSPGAEGPTASRGGAENFIALRYDDGAFWAVLSPPSKGTARVWILRDEKWLPADALGDDARLDGRGASYVEVSEPRLFFMCRALKGQHVVKLSPDVEGVSFHQFAVEPPSTAGMK